MFFTRSEALLLRLFDRRETTAQRSEHSPSGGRAGPKTRLSPAPSALTLLPAERVLSAEC